MRIVRELSRGTNSCSPGGCNPVGVELDRPQPSTTPETKHKSDGSCKGAIKGEVVSKDLAQSSFKMGEGNETVNRPYAIANAGA